MINLEKLHYNSDNYILYGFLLDIVKYNSTKGGGKMKINEDFLFLEELDDDLFKRYQMIEEALRYRNCTVFLQMQVYLEHLFKFVSKREGYNISQTTLGDFLKHTLIKDYCSLRIEFMNFDQLKEINSLGNIYKHQKLLPFNIEEFIKCIRVIYEISRKVFNHYHKLPKHNIKPLNEGYYHQVIKEEQSKTEEMSMYRSQVDFLREALIEKDEELERLQKEVEGYKEQLKKVTNNEKMVKHLTKENENLKEKVETLTSDNKTLKQQLHVISQDKEKLEKDNKFLKEFKDVAEKILSKIIAEKHIKTYDILDLNFFIEKYLPNLKHI